MKLQSLSLWKSIVVALGVAVGLGGTFACGDDGAEAPQEERTTYELTIEQSTDGGLSPLSVEFEALVDGPEPDELSYHWEFGEEGVDQGRTTSFVFEQAGRHEVSVAAEDDTEEVVARANSTVHVEDFNVEADAEDIEGIAPLRVDFSCESTTDTELDYQWEFGDGEQSGEPNPSYTYVDAGSYVATCTGIGATGAVAVDSIEIEVESASQPEVAISTSRFEGSAPLDVEFDAIVDGGHAPFDYEWDLGDGTDTVDEESFEHTYEDSGIFTATLKVTDDRGNTGFDTREIVVEPASGPNASIMASPSVGEAPLEVEFEATVEDGTAPYEYEWDLGDGTDTVTDESFAHTYEEERVYPVVLSVTDDLGNTDIDTVEIQVGPSPAPEVSITASPLAGQAPLEVEFDAIVEGGNAPYDYAWSPGDGSDEVYDESFTHTYEDSGVYAAVLEVTDDLGDTTVDIVEIDVQTASEPNASIMASPSVGEAPLEVEFDTLVEGGTAPYEYEWDLGDGTDTVSDESFAHTYQDEGVYPVVLSVTDDLGNTTMDTFEIQVGPSPAPEVSITASPLGGQVPLEVDFDAAVEGGNAPYDYRWSPGDGSDEVYDESFTHTYEEPGMYAAVLEVTDDLGDTTVDIVEIEVQTAPNPDVSITASPPQGNAPLDVEFEATITDGVEPFNYEWDPGDGSETTENANFAHIYDEQGAYTATLKVTDDLGNTGVASVIVDVAAEAPVAVAELVDEDDACVVPSSGTEIAADASDSQSPSGNALSYEWSFVALPTGSNASFAEPNSAQTTFGVDIAGTYEARVFVDDGNERVGSDIIAVEASDEANFELVDGDGQTGTVGQPLEDHAVVDVTNECGEPLAGKTVTFVGDNVQADPEDVVVEQDGTAPTQPILGTEPGEATLRAEFGYNTSEEFTFTAETGEPQNILFVPPGESYEVSDSDPVEFKFVAADEFFNPVDDEGDFEFDVTLRATTEEGWMTSSDAWFDDTGSDTAELQLDDGEVTADVFNTTAERVWPLMNPADSDVEASAWIDLYSEDFDDHQFEVGDEEVYGDVWSIGGADNWEIGTPTTGPADAVVGDHVLATKVDGDYLETTDTVSRATLHLDELFSGDEEIAPREVNVALSHYFKAPEDPHGADCALALGRVHLTGGEMPEEGAEHDDYDGLPHCEYTGFYHDPFWADGFAATGEEYTEITVDGLTGWNLGELEFLFKTSGDSQNQIFYADAGWYIDDIIVELRASTGYVDFHAGDPERLEADSEDGLADDEEAEAVVEYALTDEYGNRVYEEGVELYAWLDPDNEMEGDAGFTGIDGDRGDDFATYEGGWEASATTDENGVVALTIFNDEAERFEADAEIDAVGEDSRETTSGWFVGLDNTQTDTLQHGTVGVEPGIVRIQAYDNMNSPLRVSGIEFELAVEIDEEKPVEFGEALEGSDFWAGDDDGEHIASVKSNEDGYAEVTLEDDADDEQEEGFVVEVTGEAVNYDDTDSWTEVEFEVLSVEGDSCENPSTNVEVFGEGDWGEILGSEWVSAEEFTRTEIGHPCDSFEEQVDVFFEFTFPQPGLWFVDMGEFELIYPGGQCAYPTEQCYTPGSAIEVTEEMTMEPTVVRLLGPAEESDFVEFYLWNEG